MHNGVFLENDREERLGLPVLGLDRVLADLACTLRPWNALAVIDEALASTVELERMQLRRRIRELISIRPDPRGTRIGTRLVDLATGRAESPSESWLLWRVVDLGFPTPAANLPVLDIDGREVYRLDLGWEELKIALEYNGYAADVDQEEADAPRRRDLKQRGWIAADGGRRGRACRTRLEKELDEAFIARGVDIRGRTPGALQPTAPRAQIAVSRAVRRQTCPLAPANVPTRAANVATRGHQPAGARRRWWRPVSVTCWGGIE